MFCFLIQHPRGKRTNVKALPISEPPVLISSPVGLLHRVVLAALCVCCVAAAAALAAALPLFLLLASLRDPPPLAPAPRRSSAHPSVHGLVLQLPSSPSSRAAAGSVLRLPARLAARGPEGLGHVVVRLPPRLERGPLGLRVGVGRGGEPALARAPVPAVVVVRRYSDLARGRRGSPVGAGAVAEEGGLGSEGLLEAARALCALVERRDASSGPPSAIAVAPAPVPEPARAAPFLVVGVCCTVPGRLRFLDGRGVELGLDALVLLEVF